MKKLWMIVVAIVAAIVVGIVLTQRPAEKESKVCKIGVLYPITGDASYWGENARNGALLAVKNFSPQNKLKNYKVVALVEDSKSTPKDAVAAVSKLIYQDKIKFLVGDLASSNLLAILPIINRNKVLTIGQGSSPQLKKADDYLFRTFPSDDLQGAVIADFLQNFLRITVKKVGIIYINNEYGEGIKNVLIHRIGTTFQVVEGYPPKTKDFRRIIPKALDCNVLVIVGYPEEVPILLKQLDESGFKATVVGTETFENEKIKKLSLSYSIFYSLPKFGDISDPVVKKFRENYKSTYHCRPGVPADMAYDAMMLILKGIDSEGYNPDLVRKFLTKVKNYHGASGIINFDRYGDVVKPFIINKIEKGKSKIIWEWKLPLNKPDV